MILKDTGTVMINVVVKVQKKQKTFVFMTISTQRYTYVKTSRSNYFPGNVKSFKWYSLHHIS